MISKLPKWVWFGGGFLAFIAGTINAVGFLSFQHQGVTHLTGTTTLLGIAAAHGDFPMFFHLFGVIAFFLAGCIISGFLIQDSTLKLGRRYGLALVGESLFLFAAVPLLNRDYSLGVYLASCACGLQNGMASTYSGAVIRSGHMSGTITDLGIFIGQWLHRIPIDMRRIHLNMILVVSFFSGAVTGTIGFSRFAYETLFFPAALTGVIGLAYGIYRHYNRGTPPILN